MRSSLGWALSSASRPTTLSSHVAVVVSASRRLEAPGTPVEICLYHQSPRGKVKTAQPSKALWAWDAPAASARSSPARQGTSSSKARRTIALAAANCASKICAWTSLKIKKTVD